MSATAVVELFRRSSIAGDLKKIIIKGNVDTNAGHTVDTHADATDAKGVVFSELMDAYHTAETGVRVDATWVASTGVVTLGTVTAAGNPATVYIHIEGR